MSTTLDERVVEMRFDNSNFEKNVKTSMNTLNGLNKTIESTESAKGLKNLESTAKNIKLDGIATAVDGIASKFTTLGIIGITALQNIANRAIDTGITLVKSLSIDQIMGGFQEYELKMDSIQTIMAGTGESLERVKEKLEELNAYADKTIYSFSDMTNNISKFTNAGIDLDSSVAAIQGVANVAALAGSNSQQASHAMLNFSQALSTGYIALVDWKSIKNAQMDTLDFKQSLVETALAMGTVVKAGETYSTLTTDNNGKVGEGLSVQNLFNEGLKNQWLTTEVLTETLQQYSTDVREMTKEEKDAYEEKLKGLGYTEQQIARIEELGSKATDAATKVKTFTQLMDTLKEAVGSGWAMTFEYIIGDFEQAKKLWTDVNNEIGTLIEKQSESRNRLIRGWAELGGRTAVLKGIANIWNGLKPIAETVTKAFRDIFPKMTIIRSLELSKAFQNLTAKFKIGDETLTKLKNSLKGFFAIFDIGKQVLFAVFELVKPLFGYIFDGTTSVLGVTESMGLWLINLDKTIERSGILHKAVEKIQSICGSLASVIGFLVGKIKDFKTWIGQKFDGSAYSKFAEVMSGLSEDFAAAAEGASSFGELVKNTFDGISKAPGFKVFSETIKTIAEVLWTIGKFVANTLVRAFKSLANLLGKMDFEKVFATINFGFFTSLILGVKNLLDPLGDFGEAIQNFREDLALVQGTLKAFTANINSKSLLNIAIAIGVLALSLAVIAGIDIDKAIAGLTGVSAILTELMIAMNSLSSISGGDNLKGSLLADKKLMVLSSTLIKMSAAIFIISMAVREIADANPEGLTGAIAAILAITGGLIAVAQRLQATNDAKMMSGTTGLIMMAGAILILSKAVEPLGKLDTIRLIKGVLAVGALMTAMALFAKLTQSSSGVFTGKDGILTQEKNVKNMISIGLGMMALAGAMKILSSAAEDFAKLSWGQLGKAGAAIGSLLLALGLFTKATANSNHMISTGVGIIAIATAMKIFASAANDFAELNWGQLSRAGAAMAGIVAAMSILAKVSSSRSILKTDDSSIFSVKTSQHLLSLGVSLIAFATAMKIFASAANDFAYINWGDLAKSGAAIAAISGALILLTKFTNPVELLAISAAMIIFAGALTLMIPAIKAFSSLSFGGMLISLSAIAGAIGILALATMMFGKIAPAMAVFSIALLLFGTALSAVGVGLTLFATGVTAAFASLPAIIIFIKELLLAVINTIVEGAPAIVEGILILATQIVTGLESYLPQIVDSILNLVVTVIRVLTDRIPEIITEIKNLAKAIADSLCIELGNINMFNILLSLGAITLFLGALAAAAMIVQKALLGVAGIIAVMTAMSIVFLLLSAIDTDSITAIGVGLSTAMLAFSGAMLIISMIPAAAALQGVIGFGIFLGGFTAILAILGGLNQIPGFSWLIGEGGKVLAQLGYILGDFVGSMIGGLALGLLSKLPDMGEKLSEFMTSVQPFLDGVKSIDASVVKGVAVLCATIMSLTAAELFQTLTSWLTGGATTLVDFGKQLVEFAPYMLQYANAIEGLDAEVVTASATAASALAELAGNLPNSGGVVGWFMGENDMDKFGEQLVIFGHALKDYSYAVQGLDSAAVQESANAGMAVAELANNLPNSGGVVGWFMGENDMDEFGVQLVSFGHALKDYSIAVQGLNASVVKESADAALAVAELANNLPNTGGVAGWFMGENDIDDFGRKLVSFGYSLYTYSIAVKDLDSKVVTNSASAGKALSELANTLPNTGGLLSVFTGDNSIDQFGTQLISFGANLMSYYNCVKDIDAAHLTAITTEFTNLSTMASALGGVDAKKISGLGEAFSEAAKEGIKGFINAFDKSYSSTKETVETYIGKIIAIIKGFDDDFEKAGAGLVTKLTEGIGSKIDDAQKKVQELCEKVNKKLADSIKYSNAYDIGKNFVVGLANGIEENISLATDAAAKLAKDVETTTKSGLKEKSPSRLAYQFGSFWDLGLAYGITDYGTVVNNAVENMTDDAIGVMRDTIATIAETVETDMNTNPTITPVLDLSEIQNGSNTLNGMLSKGVAIGSLNASKVRTTGSFASSDASSSSDSASGATYNFTQNNYSPSALSAIDIYRQTKNQLAQVKGLVNA